MLRGSEGLSRQLPSNFVQTCVTVKNLTSLPFGIDIRKGQKHVICEQKVFDSKGGKDFGRSS